MHRAGYQPHYYHPNQHSNTALAAEKSRIPVTRRKENDPRAVEEEGERLFENASGGDESHASVSGTEAACLPRVRNIPVKLVDTSHWGVDGGLKHSATPGGSLSNGRVAAGKARQNYPESSRPHPDGRPLNRFPSEIPVPINFPYHYNNSYHQYHFGNEGSQGVVKPGLTNPIPVRRRSSGSRSAILPSAGNQHTRDARPFHSPPLHFGTTAARTSPNNAHFFNKNEPRVVASYGGETDANWGSHPVASESPSRYGIPTKIQPIPEDTQLPQPPNERLRLYGQASYSELRGPLPTDQRAWPSPVKMNPTAKVPIAAVDHHSGAVADVPSDALCEPDSLHGHHSSSSTGAEDEDGCVRECDGGDTRDIEEQNHGEESDAELSSDESEDPEYLELREREQIVDKYERGPDSKDVDPWENPDFELYRVTDRYGFVHKAGPSRPQEDVERRKVEKELRRESKWLRMLDEWRTHHPSKLPERIWKGVPEKLRLIIWKRLLGAETMRDNARKNLYNELLMRARLVSKDIKQIDLDINRTYRDHLAFRRRYDLKQQSLFNVLSAYAMYNTEVGYCQGMSQIAAIFLMYMDEEDAFWCLHALMSNRRFTMHGFFVPGFPKLLRFQHHYERVIQKYLPRVRKHLDRAGIPPIYLTKWWFGCFLDRIPFSLALRVWDVFLYYGDCILIPMSYNIIKLHKKTILKLDMENFMEFIQTTLAKDFGYPDDKAMESLHECLDKLQNDRMALPPPPNPDDPSEAPTRQLGPILTRSMIDIRMDIAEIQSRASRANSLAARSPAPTRRQVSARAKSPLPPRLPAGPTTSVGGGMPLGNTMTSNTSPVHSPSQTPTQKESQQALADVFTRTASVKGRRPPPPPPVPDEDGFVPMSAKQGSLKKKEPAGSISHHRVKSVYDNVSHAASKAGTTRELETNGGSTIRRTQHESIKRPAGAVHRAPNNVTYVAVDGDGEEERREAPDPPQLPFHCPPPDYDDEPTSAEDLDLDDGYARKTYGKWTTQPVGREEPTNGRSNLSKSTASSRRYRPKQ